MMVTGDLIQIRVRYDMPSTISYVNKQHIWLRPLVVLRYLGRSHHYIIFVGHYQFLVKCTLSFDKTKPDAADPMLFYRIEWKQ